MYTLKNLKITSWLLLNLIFSTTLIFAVKTPDKLLEKKAYCRNILRRFVKGEKVAMSKDDEKAIRKLVRRYYVEKFLKIEPVSLEKIDFGLPYQASDYTTEASFVVLSQDQNVYIDLNNCRENK